MLEVLSQVKTAGRFLRIMVTVPWAAGSPRCALLHESPGLTRTVISKSDSLLVGVSLSLSLFNNIDLAANLGYQY